MLERCLKSFLKEKPKKDDQPIIPKNLKDLTTIDEENNIMVGVINSTNGDTDSDLVFEVSISGIESESICMGKLEDPIEDSFDQCYLFQNCHNSSCFRC